MNGTAVTMGAPGLWRKVALISGGFCALVGIAFVIGYLTIRETAPLVSPALGAAKEKLREHPTDAKIKESIRAIDLELRESYFRRLSRTKSGVYLLLAGAVLFVVAVNKSAFSSPFRFGPKRDQERLRRAASAARWSVAGAGMGAAALLLALSLGPGASVPRREAEVDKLLGIDSSPAGATAAADAAAADELRRNWPCFRGPEGSGAAFWTNAPASWNPTNGEGIAWKVPSPTSGFNSPIVWNDKIFISGGDAEKREVVCLSGKNGEVLWRKALEKVPGSPATQPEIPESTGWAAPTMATDGRRIYVMFANGDVAALTLEGQLVWSKSFWPLKNAYGAATSLATWQDRLILQLDQGEAEENKSKLLALDGRSGRIIWQKPRRVGASWASPTVFTAAGKGQIVALSLPHAIAYSADDGSELWRVECLNGEVTPSPAFAGGLVLVASPAEKLLAIRPDGKGDVTKTHVAWSSEDNVPDVTSPASNGELAFTATTSGMLTCYDARDGKKLWEHDLETEVHASPTISGNRVYLFSQKGLTVVVEAAREVKEVFRTELPDSFHSTPAFLPDRIIARGLTNIWCFGRTTSPATAGK